MENFEKVKKRVLRRFPGATTQMDSQGKFYVADKDGYDIMNRSIIETLNSDQYDTWDETEAALNNISQIPHSNTVEEAWGKADTAAQAFHIIGVNTARFSVEKSIKYNDIL